MHWKYKPIKVTPRGEWDWPVVQNGTGRLCRMGLAGCADRERRLGGGGGGEVDVAEGEVEVAEDSREACDDSRHRKGL